jgi:iron(III) transport system ATP-binding protein
MAAGIQVSKLTKNFKNTQVVKELDLEVNEGEIVVLLGPSGCGKTTTLRCLAGLETPSGGRITLNDRVVYDDAGRVDIPTHKRNIGMVFQSYALWPHMTVRQNIAYPLKVSGMGKVQRAEWVERAADLVHCGNLLDRYPAQLSGGQQQRIALARGLVARPTLVLLDEPLSNLDAKLRDQVRTQIRELHQELGFTGVLVTHDQEEALALGDRIAIMRDGKIEQYDTPERVFVKPETDYVASFIGLSNRIEWRREDAHWVTDSGTRIPLADLGGLTADSAVSTIRPDDMRIHQTPPADTAGSLVLSTTLITAEYLGRHVDVTALAGNTRLQARVRGADQAWVRNLPSGAPLIITTPLENLHTYPAETSV